MFKEKLNKRFYTTLVENKLETPTPLQEQGLPKINSGGDVIFVAPEGSGKSTLVSIASIHKLQRAIDDVPKVLILAGSNETGKTLLEQLKSFTRGTDLRVNAAFEDGKIDAQNAEIYEGTDILIGTPKRLLDLYFASSINLNKLKLFVMDDPELMIKHSWQGQVDRLTSSLPKCQHLVFTTELNEKVEKLIHKFMVAPYLIEIE
ncbi:DEAD/DEAH box helicase [Sphingobacteriaceae bacterium]|nr:DEAD/DEAH box helicase [Sphingobacteriaceae bacterium]